MMAIANECLTDVYQRMAEVAALAPSAENTQPWHFQVSESQLIVCLDRSRTLASDVDFMLDLTSLGTCTENALVAAREAGFEPTIEILANQDDLQRSTGFMPVASVTCSLPGEADPLHGYLASRCTSRRMSSKKLEETQLIEFSESISDIPGVQVDWVTGEEKWKEIAQLVGIGNRIRFEYQPFHQEFYKNVRITSEEVTATRDGLDLATLQLPLGVSSIMAFLRKWPRMQLANLLGFSRGVARQATVEMLSSGAIGILTVEGANVKNFLNGGRALERLWLWATAANLGFHPAAALAVFLAYADRIDGVRLLPRHQRMSQTMQHRFNKLYPELSERKVQMVFRIGYADVPTVRSLRRDLDDVLDLRSGNLVQK